MRIQSLKPVGRTIFTVYTESILLDKNTIVARVCFSLRKGSEAYASLSKTVLGTGVGPGGTLRAGKICLCVRSEAPFWTFFSVLRQKRGPFTFQRICGFWGGVERSRSVLDSQVRVDFFTCRGFSSPNSLYFSLFLVKNGKKKEYENYDPPKLWPVQNYDRLRRE